MAALEEKRNGRFAIRWWEGDRQRQQTLPEGTKRREAEKIRREIEGAVARGERWDPRAKFAAPLLGDDPPGSGNGAIAVYLRSLGRRGLKDSTINEVKMALTPWGRWMQERLRRRPDLGDLSARNLEDFYDEKAAQVSTRRAAVCARMVEAFWAWLHTRDEYAGWTPPMRRLDLPPPTVELQPYALTWAELDKIILTEEAREDTYGNKAWWRGRVLTIQRYTGLRVSQAGRLEWRDLDISRKLLTIRPELGKTRQEAHGRVVPVSPHLIDAVSGWGVREGYLAGTASFDSMGFPRDFGRWRLIVEQAGFTKEQIPQPTHCFRRTFVAELVRARVPEAVIKLFVGHDPGLTAGVYADHDEALREQAVEALDKIPAIGAAGRVVKLERKNG